MAVLYGLVFGHMLCVIGVPQLDASNGKKITQSSTELKIGWDIRKQIRH